jgi:hypothetical protein
MRLPTRQIVLEGCDLSGKTTFYSEFHRETGFEYDVRDRGPISRLVYSRLYDRNPVHESVQTNRFLDDLNNVVIMLSPGWNLISSRFETRGDEMHNLDSLRKTWESFKSISDGLKNHPSILCFESSPDADLARDLVRSRESVTTAKIADYVQRSLASTGRNESLNTQFEIVASPDDDLGPDTLQVPGEEEYYADLRNSMLQKVENEIKLNGQSETSRRFVTTNDSCVSYLRFIHRDDCDTVDLVCRSTNVPKNLKTDLDAIIHIAFQAQRLAGLEKRNITFRVKLNCAHIIP